MASHDVYLDGVSGAGHDVYLYPDGPHSTGGTEFVFVGGSFAQAEHIEISTDPRNVFITWPAQGGSVTEGEDSFGGYALAQAIDRGGCMVEGHALSGDFTTTMRNPLEDFAEGEDFAVRTYFRGPQTRSSIRARSGRNLARLTSTGRSRIATGVSVTTFKLCSHGKSRVKL